MRNLDQAEQAALKALEAAESFPPDDRRQGITLEFLTEILFQQKKYDLCAPFLVRLQAMYRRCLGVDHLDTGTILHNLALLYQNSGKHKAADVCYREAIRIKSLSLGKDHPDVVAMTGQYARLSKELEPAAKIGSPVIIRKQSLKRTGQFTEFKMPGDDEFKLQ